MLLMAKSPGNRVSADCQWIAYFRFREGNDQTKVCIVGASDDYNPLVTATFSSRGVPLGLVDLTDSVGWGLTACRQ